ncbi:hypothetical protein [Hymenobacter algoricola]|uniref:Auto-transporter adhesin head GIN domain-containing protein n=1 Tax=Hymenobacter algoricola TaxID=486267 RepID=A0ABP7N0S4_9BACT
MKTSNKLLLTTLALLLGSLLTYNLALRAEYRKGSYKDKDLFRNYTTLAHQDFSAVQVVGSGLSVKISSGPFAVRVNKGATGRVSITQVGSRLVVTSRPATDTDWSGNSAVLISCPRLTALTTDGNTLDVSGFTLDSLAIEQNRTGEVALTDNRIGYLRATAGRSAGSRSTLKIDATNRIQAARLSVQSQGELELENVFIPQFSCQFSDSAAATVSGASLRMMRQ